MQRNRVLRIAVLGACLAAPVRGDDTVRGDDRVQFNRDVRPILSNHCVKCHGRDANQRRAGLRLDVQHQAERPLPSGRRAVVPGKVAKSELLRRVASHDPDMQMPPPGTTGRLSRQQIRILTSWIQQGARWQKHWSYVPVRRPALPSIKDRSWVQNPIDRFVLARLERKGWKPARSASRLTLARRISFGLTGLPPTASELHRLARDERPNAISRYAQRLLGSPEYGERMATQWLDLARYADTHGYHTDSHRDMWRWRDWVIQAYNANMPFDQFTIWQIAGDLLPNATLQMKLASGFHRNSMINFENGAIAAEYLNEYIVDRVVTTGTVWLGQTLECCRCHDHKYDPLSQRDFYQLYAYFNSMDEKGLDGQTGNAQPILVAPTYLQQLQLKQWRDREQTIVAELKLRGKRVQRDIANWERRLRRGKAKLASPPTDAIVHLPFDETGGKVAKDPRRANVTGKIVGPAFFYPGKFGNALLFGGETHVRVQRKQTGKKRPQVFGVWVYPTVDDRLSVGLWRLDKRVVELQVVGRNVRLQVQDQGTDRSLALTGDAGIASREWQHLFCSVPTGKLIPEKILLYRNGRRVVSKATSAKIDKSTQSELGITIGSGVADDERFRGFLDDFQAFDRHLSAEEVQRLAGSDPIRVIVSIPHKKRTVAQRRKITDYYLRNVDKVATAWHRELKQIRSRREALRRQLPTSMVMQQSNKPRPTYILAGGDYRKKLQRVFPRTPAALPDLAGQPANRLGLARWLVHRRHPLTARVAVNRIWQLHFGHGLVRTPEDFGSRGQWPTHPQLLDWLAAEFMDRGWDVKYLHRLIVESSAYQQTSRVSRKRYSADPINRWLARGPRVRLTAEMIRDQALMQSGLLVSRLHGPSVYPYQPPGLWKAVSYNPRDYTAQIYIQGHGASLYRRSVYTFWKRSVPPPAMSILGAPNREVCTVQRRQTNTPLQALLRMNDVTFVEAARVLAQRNLARHPAWNTEVRTRKLFEQVVGRPPQRRELQIVMKVQSLLRLEYQRNPVEVKKLLTVGESPPPTKTRSTVDVAAWTGVINMLMNLDETITRN